MRIRFSQFTAFPTWLRRYFRQFVCAARQDITVALLLKGVMRDLKNPDIFNQVSIDDKGRSIVWEAQDIDFCADALRLKFYSD